MFVTLQIKSNLMKKHLLYIFLFTSLISYSQSGITWNSALNIAPGTFGNYHPRIVLDSKGSPLVIWGRSSDQALLFTRWDGTTFTTPVKLNPDWLTIATATWMGPDIASKGDTVYVVMKKAPEGTDTSHIYIMSSFNGGQSFSSPTIIESIADSFCRFPTVTIDYNGNPIVAFMKFNSSFSQARWAVSKSVDYGNSFLPDIKASGWSGANSLVCDCCPGSIVSSGDYTAMVYRDNLNNKRDIWTGLSTDNSNSFTTGFNVDNGKWIINSCPASGPEGIIIGDTLYTVYMSGAAGSYRTFLSKASLLTGTIGSVSKLTGTISGLGEQNYPRIATDGTASAIVWTQNVSGTAQLPILFTNDIKKGFPVSPENVDVSNITNTDVALKDGKIYVVWEDDNFGTVKFRSGTYDEVITQISPDLNNKVKLYPNPVSGILNVETELQEVSQIKIYNQIGELIDTKQSDSNLQINTSGYPEGIYYLQLKTSNDLKTMKFIKSSK